MPQDLREYDDGILSTSHTISILSSIMQPTLPLQRAIKRLALTTKQGPHNFYKGNGTGALGTHTKYGTYKIDWAKVRTYQCPDLSDFAVRTHFSSAED